MAKLSTALTVSLMIVTGIIGVGIGYYLTPQYQQTMFNKNEMSLGPADRSVDQRYINAMITHHRGAILVAEQAITTSERKEIRDLAGEILQNEPKLIAELYAWKKDWYKDTRTVRDPIVPRLGDFSPTFDLRFLNAVIAHHEAGIAMTREIRSKSSRAEVLDNADVVEAFLTKSGAMLQGWRKQWYNI